MPDIGVFHPQLVHFVIVLAITGVVCRLASLTGKLKWTGPAAAAMLIGAGAIGFFTARAGHDAHGPVERIPGVREAVEEHEEWGDRARNILLLVGAIELIGLALRKPKVARAVHALSAVVGLGALYVVYETAEHGGDLVYSYAGGVGIRSGDPADLDRLLVAGLYNQGLADRAAGRPEDAARLFDELARRRPDDLSAQLLGVESRLDDRGDGAGALEWLRRIGSPADSPRLALQHKALVARAYAAAGFHDSALSVLAELKQAAPTSRLVEDLERRLGAAP